MGLNSLIQPTLHPVHLRELRPTQMTVGLREVQRKRSEWRDRPRDTAGAYLGSHMIPAVIGPNEQPWIVDHHHLALALHLEGVEQVLVSVVARLDHLPKKRFMAFMDAHNWLHPYDRDGRRQDWKDIPRSIGKLTDDPHRSLAGEVRRAGGYAKSQAPYSEFLWADFLRDRIARQTVEDKFTKAILKGIELARSHHARHLPGWAGAEAETA